MMRFFRKLFRKKPPKQTHCAKCGAGRSTCIAEPVGFAQRGREGVISSSDASTFLGSVFQCNGCWIGICGKCTSQYPSEPPQPSVKSAKGVFVFHSRSQDDAKPTVMRCFCPKCGNEL